MNDTRAGFIKEVQLMFVQDIMTPDPVIVEDDSTIVNAMWMMMEHDVRHLPVVAEGRVVGVLTDRDVQRTQPNAGPGWSQPVHAVMSSPAITLPPDATVDEAAWLMETHRIGCLPIVEANGRPVGIVTDRDLLRLMRQFVATRGREARAQAYADALLAFSASGARCLQNSWTEGVERKSPR